MRDARGEHVFGERQRVTAIQQLDQFATGAIEPSVLHALDDGSAQVRREALRLCFEREISACIPHAAAMWSRGGQATVRVAALKVLALDLGPTQAAILIEALRDPAEVIRAQAADFLGTAPLGPKVRPQVRTALLAKLADVSALVRRRAVLSLGLLGPGDGTLSIARLLSDPEPTVRAAAAQALGHRRDPTAVPALRRAIATPNEASVATELLEALAMQPDPSVETDLLTLLDNPPPGLNEMQIADTIGRRADPGPELIEGLVARLDEPPRREAALQALLLFGEDARAALEDALARGLAPPIEVEVQLLVSALNPAAVPSLLPSPWPGDDDRPAWRQRMREGDRLARLRAGWTLAQRDPAWRVPMAVAEVARPGVIASRRSWVLSLAASPDGWSTERDAEARARLEGWARDRTIATADRCLAIAALGARTPERRDARRWAELATDPHEQIRACVALALGRHGDTERLAALLVDPRGTVRTNAAVGLAFVDAKDIDRTTRARLALLALEDSDPAVRAAAAFAREHRDSNPSATTRPGLFLRRAPSFPWADPPSEVEVQLDGWRLWVPTVGHGAWRWALVPGFARGEGSPEIETLPARDPAP